MIRLATACCLLLAATPALADESRLERAQGCARIEAGPERLACYDALFRAPDRPPAPPPAAVLEEDFGLDAGQRERRRQERGESVAPDSITSRVASVEESATGPVVLALENGQRWVLLESSLVTQFEAGDDITIRRGALGSYVASSAARKRGWRVRRVD